MKSILFSITVLLLFLTACRPSINGENLHGVWKYEKVNNPYGTPSDSVPNSELIKQSPSISFTKEGDLIILWDNKKLSSGKYRLEGNIIRYTENLPGGKVREFPFLIVDLSAEYLTFQTMVQDATLVRAKRVR